MFSHRHQTRVSHGAIARLAFAFALVLASTCAYAAVAYVPVFTTNNPPDLSLNYLGIRRFELPSLRELGTITDLPPIDPCGCFYVNEDGSRLFIYSLGVLRVFDGRGHQLLHTWNNLPFSACNPIFHSRRPNVLIFNGTEWFDFESGSLVESAQSLGFLFPNRSGRRATQSTGKRFLVVSETTNAFAGGFELVRVIDMLGILPSRNFAAINGNAVAAFNDRVLVARPTVSSPLNYYDIATGDLVGPTVLPPGTTAAFVLPGPRDSVVFESVANQVASYAIQTAMDAPIVPFSGIPTDPLRRPLYLERSGPFLLTRRDHTDLGCVVFIPVPLYAGPMLMSVYDIESNSSTTVEYSALGSTFGAAPVIAGEEQVPQPVPTSSSRALWLLYVAIASLGAWALQRQRRTIAHRLQTSASNPS